MLLFQQPFLAAVFFYTVVRIKLEEVQKYNQKDIAVEVGKNVLIKYSIGGKKKGHPDRGDNEPGAGYSSICGISQ